MNIALGVQPLQLQLPDPNAGMNALMRAMQIKNAMGEDDLNRLKMKEHQRGLDETTALNEAYRGALGDDGSVDHNKLYTILAQKNLGAKIPGVQKQVMEAQEAQYKVQNEAAKGYDRFRKTIGAHAAQPNPSPEAVAADVQGLVAAGTMNGSVAQRLLAAMPADPQQLRVYLQRAATSQMDPKDMLTVFAPKPEKVDDGQQIGFRDVNSLSPTYGQATAGAPVQKQPTPADQIRAVNEPFMVGPDGKPVPNVPAQSFQKEKARAGATTVSVSTEKGYAGHMAEGLAKQDLAAIDAARSAPERITNAQRIKQILDTQPTITGSGAEGRLAFQKALSTAGLIDGQAVKSTEDLASLLASSTLDAIRTSGLGSGQGFTDKDRQFLERARSGNIEINAGTIRTLADMNEKAARASIEAGARVAGRLKGNPTFGSVGQDLPMSQPPEYRPPPVVRKPPTAGAPAGGRFLGFE